MKKPPTGEPMRENRPYGSEGGVAKSHPDPYPICAE